MPQIDYDELDVDWLDTLIGSYERMRRLDSDAAEDPDGADTMVRECGRLAERLRAALPEREPEADLTPEERAEIPW